MIVLSFLEIEFTLRKKGTLPCLFVNALQRKYLLYKINIDFRFDLYIHEAVQIRAEVQLKQSVDIQNKIFQK